MVSGNHVHFGVRGGMLHLISNPDSFVLVRTHQCSLPTILLGMFYFYTFHPPQDNTCGFRKASTTDKDNNLTNG